MARQAFFTFHYQRDIFRVNVVRNSQEFVRSQMTPTFYDHSLWEKTKLQGDEAIKRLINSGLKGSSVTVVLVGNETAGRKWVNYEIVESHNQGMGILAVRIHNIADVNGHTNYAGRNPLDDWQVGGVPFSKLYPTYDWVSDNGFKNIPSWIEQAARKAGR